MVKFSIHGFEVSVTFGFLLVITLLSVTSSPSLGFTAIASCVIHELGHCFAAVILNVKIKSLTLWAGGVQMQRESRLVSVGTELFILISGPLFNLIFAVIYSLYGLSDAAGVNLALAIFNLFPYSSLDGGCVIRAFLERKSQDFSIIQKISAAAFGITVLLYLHFADAGNITAYATIILLTVNDFF